MSHIIQCSMHATPEALERILQVVRIRGFTLNAMQVARDDDALQVDLRLSGARSLDNLIRQLEKLVGMQAVQGLASVAAKPKTEVRFEARAVAAGG